MLVDDNKIGKICTTAAVANHKTDVATHTPFEDKISGITTYFINQTKYPETWTYGELKTYQESEYQ